MKNIYKNLALLMFLTVTLIYPSSGILKAEINKDTVCDAVTAQSTMTKNEDLKDKMIVITEERLGIPDNKTTFNCFRKIECTVGPQTPKEAANTTNTTQTTTTTPPQTSPSTTAQNTALIRKCEATYVTSGCTPTPPTELTDKMQMKDGNAYTICEPIMVYMTGAGTELLFYYVGQVYSYMSTLGGMIAVLILIVAGIMRTTAGDNTNQITTANNLIKKCLLGLVVLFLSAIILYTINPNFFVINK